MVEQVAEGTDRTDSEVEKLNLKVGALRKEQITSACVQGSQQWNDPEAEAADQARILANNSVVIPGADASITATEAAQNPGILERADRKN